MALKSRNM